MLANVPLEARIMSEEPFGPVAIINPIDSLDAARYLRDNEEYWPFEGDDWPDEFVGEK